MTTTTDAGMSAGNLPVRRDVHFPSGEERCHAWLYLPAVSLPEAAAPPVIVMAHGLGAVKTLRLAAFAERFRAAGYACLIFDYRHRIPMRSGAS